MGIERREFVRQRVSRVEVRVASQEAFRASYLRDLSMGGLFVRSKQPLAQGTAVVVELSVEARPPVRLRGEVMRQEHAADGTPRGFGVRFSTVDGETKQALEQILAAHQQLAQAVTADTAQLETQLAEARGSIEAYEETLAHLREDEAVTQQKLEASQAENAVMMRSTLELQQRVHALEAERSALRANVDALSVRVAKGDATLATLHETTTRLATDLKAARSQTGFREDAIVRVMEEFEAETRRSVALKAEFDAELRALKEQLEARVDVGLRSELQELAAQLDDERLRSMALERALKRFVDMGGVVPK